LLFSGIKKLNDEKFEYYFNQSLTALFEWNKSIFMNIQNQKLSNL
jgi:hypothetical protein